MSQWKSFEYLETNEWSLFSHWFMKDTGSSFSCCTSQCSSLCWYGCDWQMLRTLQKAKHLETPWWNCVRGTFTFGCSKTECPQNYFQGKTTRNSRVFFFLTFFKYTNCRFIVAGIFYPLIVCLIEYALAFLVSSSFNDFVQKAWFVAMLGIIGADFLLKLLFSCITSQIKQ
jgi:hypothetical protein